MNFKKLFYIAIIGTIIDIIFTYISNQLYPGFLTTYEGNALLKQGNFIGVAALTITYIFLFYHAMFMIKSLLYTILYSFALIGLRFYAIMTHPLFWIYLYSNMSIGMRTLLHMIIIIISLIIWFILIIKLIKNRRKLWM